MKAVAIFNPRAGRGRALRRLEQFQQQQQQLALDLWPTTAPGHAEELAWQAVQQSYDLVVAAGGDGTVHEVANGLLRSRNRAVRLGVLPIGSANDYAASLDLDGVPGSIMERWVDVGVVRAPSGKERYFVCCLGLGLNGAVTLESRKIRSLQGMPLYLLATLKALWRHYACSPLELSFDEQPTLTLPTLMLSVLVGRREGGFVLAPRASLDDGYFDYLHVGQLSRCQVLWLLPRVALNGPPEHHAQVRQGRCRRLRIQSERPLLVHIDGEFLCQPEDPVRDLEIELLPRWLCVLRLNAGKK